MCLILSLAGCFSSNVPKRHPQAVSKAKHRECKKTQIVAVVDTGFGADDTWTGQEKTHLCKYGHKDFTGGKTSDKFGTVDPVPVDDHGHGTHIAGTIDEYAKKTNGSFCLVILKYYDPKGLDLYNLDRTVEAFNYARQIHADYINYSGGGVSSSTKEAEAVKAFIDSGGTFVAAAGNEGSDLEIHHYYPAQEDDRVIAVGNGKSEKDHAYSSNHGKRVNRWEQGMDVLTYNHYMSGTSQAAAIATGKIVAEKNKSCK